MYIIREFMVDEHELLDKLFAEFLDLKGRDPGQARGNFARIKALLTQRIALEDGVLFPFYEECRGHADGSPTLTMREQHRQIREVLEMLEAELEAHPGQTHGLENELAALLNVHMAVEDEFFIPWVQQLDAATRDALQAKMAAFCAKQAG